MMHIRTLVLSLFAFTLLLGTAAAAGVAFDAYGFDAYEEEGYVDIVRDGDVLTVEPEHVAGPVRSYDLSDGDASWRLAFTATGFGAVIQLQAF